MLKSILGIILLATTLTGCSVFQPPTTLSVSPNATPRAAKDIHQWQLSGKIAVQTAQDAGSANVNWTQRDDTYRIALSGPLGAHSLLLTGQPGTVTLLAADGKRYHANSPEQLLARQWGFHLPVSSMRYWIRGLPVPGIPATTRYDSKGRLLSLVQRDFHIAYLGYVQHGSTALPEKLTITSSTLRVKMIIHEWTI